MEFKKILKPHTQARTDRDIKIVKEYIEYNNTVEYIAHKYQLNVRSIQRIVKSYGMVRTVAQANKQSARLKVYPKKPEHLKVKRKHLTSKLRYEVLSTSKGCVVCGLSRKEGAILHVDHIDNNPQNNDIVNLQVLCSDCNLGKYRACSVTLKMAP